MSATPVTPVPSPLRAPPADVLLRSWPLVDEPRRSAVVLFVVAAVGVLAATVTGQAPPGLLASGVLLVALWRIVVPLRFEIAAAGVTQTVWRRKRRIPWTAIGRCEPRPTGLLVWGDDAAPAIDVFRALFIPWCGRRDEALELMQYYAPSKLANR